ncbi:MAG: hypothetical protein H8E63_07515 [Proteobacteria bacterium]|jgi:hypothetical protein|nr:hypothetical protein [Pseudomonadota bacterium]
MSEEPEVVIVNPADEKPGWFDKPSNVNKIVWTLVAMCIASVVADFFYQKDAHYDFQAYPGFDAVYGFVSFVFLVLVAKQLRKIVMRDEDYYD